MSRKRKKGCEQRKADCSLEVSSLNFCRIASNRFIISCSLHCDSPFDTIAAELHSYFNISAQQIFVLTLSPLSNHSFDCYIVITHCKFSSQCFYSWTILSICSIYFSGSFYCNDYYNLLPTLQVNHTLCMHLEMQDQCV